MEYKLSTSTWCKSEIKAIQDVIETDKFSMGPKVEEYEKMFANFFGSNYAVMCSSGSTANLLMVASMFFSKNPKLKHGDEIIVPAVSWSTTYFPLQQYGLKLKFVDIDLETLNYDLESLSEAISEQTKLIVIVNLLGNPNDFDAISAMIKDKNIILLEDNCESLGAEYGGRQAGTFGLLGTYSTFFSHHIATMEGGFVTTNDDELYHILLSIRAHGWTRNLPKENLVSNKSDDWFTESFRFVLPGYNVRPIEMSGAIGVEQLKKLPKFIENRRLNALTFNKLFVNHPDFMIQKEIGKSSWFGFSLIIRPESSLIRKDVVDLLSENGIECRPIVTGDFTQNEVMKYFDYEIFGNLSNAKYLHDNGLFVGNHQNIITDELNLLSKVLKRN